MERSALTTLVPSDAAVAVRSLPRRFRQSFRPQELEGAPGAIDPRALPSGGGPSPVGLVLATSRALDALRKALNTTLVHDGPELDATVFDRERRDRPEDDRASIDAALSALDSSCSAFAADIDRTSLDSWNRAATVGGQQVDALELLKEAVASTRTYLDRLGPTLERLRREA